MLEVLEVLEVEAKLWPHLPASSPWLWRSAAPATRKHDKLEPKPIEQPFLKICLTTSPGPCTGMESMGRPVDMTMHAPKSSPWMVMGCPLQKYLSQKPTSKT